MTDIALDDLSRARFEWPDALLIDLISESYGGPPAAPERMAAARLHVRFLRELLDGAAATATAAALRLDLLGCCAARGIALDAIEAADRAAFREMIDTVKTRFRNSPRHQLAFLKRLHEALGRLPRREPANKPVPAPRPALVLREQRERLVVARKVQVAA